MILCWHLSHVTKCVDEEMHALCWLITVLLLAAAAWAVRSSIVLHRYKQIYARIINVAPHEHVPRVTLHQEYDAHGTIPKIIHITLADKTSTCCTAKVRQIQQQYPDWKLRVYDNADCIALITRHFELPVVRAYHKINPKYGAMQADLFRYCVLFVSGGFYIDFTLDLPAQLDMLDLSADAYLVPLQSKNLYRKRKKAYAMYEQWAMLFKPSHPYLKTIVESITFNILNNVFPPYDVKWYELSFLFSDNKSFRPGKHAVLNITGPDAFSAGIHECTHGNMHAILHMKRVVQKNVKHNLYVNRKHYSELEEPIYVPGFH